MIRRLLMVVMIELVPLAGALVALWRALDQARLGLASNLTPRPARAAIEARRLGPGGLSL